MIQIDDNGPIRTLTIDSPGRRNAIPAEGWPSLEQAFRDFEASDSRVLIVTGAGGDFCSGADLDPGQMSGAGIVERQERMRLVGRAALALHTLTKPTVAAVDGVAVGAGMNLALGCDIVIATTRARFSEIFVKRGLTLDFGGSWLLPRIVGLQRAKELALTGRIVAADEAVKLGIAIEAVEPDRLLDRAMEIASSLLEGAPIGQMFAKQALNRSWQLSFEESLGWEDQSQSICMGTSDVVEGVAAFLQKRPPEFTGR